MASSTPLPAKWSAWSFPFLWNSELRPSCTSTSVACPFVLTRLISFESMSSILSQNSFHKSAAVLAEATHHLLPLAQPSGTSWLSIQIVKGGIQAQPALLAALGALPLRAPSVKASPVAEKSRGISTPPQHLTVWRGTAGGAWARGTPCWKSGSSQCNAL